MRKHFLLLFLMALLPLAGWADTDISKLNFTIAHDSYVYDGNPVDVDEKLYVTNVENPISDSNYTLYFKKGSEAETTDAPTNVGTYQVQARANANTGYTGSTTWVTFDITKANIDPTDVTAPTAKDALEYDGTDKVLINTGSVDEAYGELYYKVGVNGTWTKVVANIKAQNAGEYSVYYYVKGSDNYND